MGVSQAPSHLVVQSLILHALSKVSKVVDKKIRLTIQPGLTADLLRKYKHMESMIQFYDQVKSQL